MSGLRMLGWKHGIMINRQIAWHHTITYPTALRSAACLQRHSPSTRFRTLQVTPALLTLPSSRCLRTTPLVHSEEKSPSPQKNQILPKPTKHENIYTIPNILTFSRLLCAPAVGYLILHDSHVFAAALFVYAGVTDLVDGYIARRYSLQTVVGTVIDPMADKALMTIAIVCLAINGALPLSLTTIILGRDVSLALAAIYYRFASLPPPRTLTRYWDFSLPSAEVHPTFASKVNTSLQLVLVGSAIALPLITTSSLDLGSWEHVTMTAFQGVVACTTLWSGASYAWRKDVVKILGEDEVLKKKQGFRGRMIIGVSYAVFVAIAAYFWREELQASNVKKNSDSDEA